MEGKEIVVRGDKELAIYELETQFAMAVRQRELLENYIRERLKPDKHFYTVGDEPGRKPSLTKEGAELICLPHALKARYKWLSGPEYPPMDDAAYQITMKCEMEGSGKFAGEGVGSASSMVTRKTGERVQRQKDPGLRHNATIKMACKSAYIAATLNSTAASEFFTQDLEDDQTGDFKKSSEDKANEHWCEKHHTKFFKTEKMKAWAHPVKNEDGSQVLDDNGKPLWCSEKAEKSTPQSKTTQPAPQPVTTKSEGVEEQPSPIDLTWLKEALDKIEQSGVEKWGKRDVLARLNITVNGEHKKISDAVRQLSAEQAADFASEVADMLKML